MFPFIDILWKTSHLQPWNQEQIRMIRAKSRDRALRKRESAKSTISGYYFIR